MDKDSLSPFPRDSLLCESTGLLTPIPTLRAQLGNTLLWSSPGWWEGTAAHELRRQRQLGMERDRRPALLRPQLPAHQAACLFSVLQLQRLTNTFF